jgi:drug/metabolite transporter (DMT)-like permease
MLIGGALCGVFLAISVNLQQFGLALYPAGAASEARAGFLTALYVVIVPIISVFVGKKIKAPMWIAVAVATVGIYLLSLSGGLDSIYFGDVLVFCCAISFSLHILVVDRYGDPVGGILLSMMQFLVCGVISGILSLCFESVDWANVLAATPQILYLGIMSSGIAYTLQIYGQKFAEPAVASITMSLESVFAALGGWLISGNTLTLPEFCGCALVFVAILVAQIPQFFEKKASSVANSVESNE